MPLLLAAALAALILVNKSLPFRIASEGLSLRGTVWLSLFGRRFRLLRFRVFPKAGAGLMISVNGAPPRPAAEKKRRRGRSRMRPLAFLRVKELGISCTAGLSGRPDTGVILAGALGAVLSSAAALLKPERARLSITPDLQKTVFDLNVEGIAVFSPGKLVMEIIKSKRR